MSRRAEHRRNGRRTISQRGLPRDRRHSPIIWLRLKPVCERRATSENVLRFERIRHTLVLAPNERAVFVTKTIAC